MAYSAVELFKSLSGEIDPELLQRKFLLSLLELHHVSRGSIWIKRDDSYECIEAAGVESEQIRGISIPASRTSIVGWVIENGEMTVADPSDDKRHYRELEENLAVRSRLILCFPLFLRDKTVYGAVQIIDTSSNSDRLNLEPEELERIQDLVNIGSIALSNAIFFNDTVKEARDLKHTLNQIRSEGVILGQSPAFLKILELIRSYAVTDYPILITGESGTGKELAAHRIHALSNRRDKPFYVQNCSAIPETLLESELFGHKRGAFTGAIEDKVGLFEAADGGTVFLDEIGDMPMNLQARILRVIQNNEVKPLGELRVKKVDIRVVSATNKNIQQAVQAGEFRQDLFFRLSVLPLHLPPLRERKEDISLLFNHFMKREALRMGLPVKAVTKEAMRRLINHGWSGNIREVENLARYLLVVTDGDRIEPNDLPFFFDADEGEGVSTNAEGIQELPVADYSNIKFGNLTWDEVERAYIRYLLHKTKGNVSKSAQEAGMNRSTFASRMRRLNIKRR